MTTIYAVDQYTEHIRNAANSKGANRVIIMRKAREVHEQMDYRGHQDLIEQVKTFSLTEIKIMLGAGLKDPSREIFLTRAAELEDAAFKGY